jgi:hypothetical protein
VRSKGLTPAGTFFCLNEESSFEKSLLFRVLANPTVVAKEIAFYPPIFGIEDIKVSSP